MFVIIANFLLLLRHLFRLPAHPVQYVLRFGREPGAELVGVDLVRLDRQVIVRDGVQVVLDVLFQFCKDGVLVLLSSALVLLLQMICRIK